MKERNLQKNFISIILMRTNKLKQELHEIETQNSDDSDYCAAHVTDSSSKVFLIFFFKHFFLIYFTVSWLCSMHVFQIIVSFWALFLVIICLCTVVLTAKEEEEEEEAAEEEEDSAIGEKGKGCFKKA